MSLYLPWPDTQISYSLTVQPVPDAESQSVYAGVTTRTNSWAPEMESEQETEPSISHPPSYAGEESPISAHSLQPQ